MRKKLITLLASTLILYSSITGFSGITAQAASYDSYSVLTPESGINYGPSGLETYYNLDMSVVVSNLQAAGYEGSYWVREDGCKMFGSYIMVAADYNVYPYGSIVSTSLGAGIVCDTGAFANGASTQIDIAVNW